MAILKKRLNVSRGLDNYSLPLILIKICFLSYIAVAYMLQVLTTVVLLAWGYMLWSCRHASIKFIPKTPIVIDTVFPTGN